LHTYVDASQEAYGAATYSRHLYEDGTVTCGLVASKSSVAPLQAVSIPRLELMAAVVGLRLAGAIGSVFNVPKHDWLFWQIVWTICTGSVVGAKNSNLSGQTLLAKFSQ